MTQAMIGSMKHKEYQKMHKFTKHTYQKGLSQSQLGINMAKRQSILTLTMGASFMAMGLLTNNANANIDFENAMQPRILGDANAPVTIIEYASMTCGHCARFHQEILPKIKEKYIDTGKIKLDYRDFPLDGVALQVSMMLRCLPTNLYFRALAVTFKQQSKWLRSNNPVEAVQKLLSMVGMNATKTKTCLSNAPLQKSVVESRMMGVEKHAVSGTPTLIIGKVNISGVRDLSDYTDAIDDLL